MSATAKIITYDLMAPGQDYSGLIDAIESYTYVKITESCYVVETTDSYNTIFDKLRKYMDKNDRLFVSKLALGSSWVNIIGNSDDFKVMKKN